jgi:hypothetical protein
MNNRISISILAAVLLVPGIALAESGKITILSPSDGAMVEPDFTFKLKYKAVAGADGDHLHLSVDGKDVAMIHDLKGTTDVWPLSPGMHKICLSVHTKDHKSTGAEQCINVNSMRM